jgi:D-alanyl-D-alanine endopeptidase (penicillin-binding protein 7)
MHKLTVFFGLLVVALGAALGWSVWKLQHPTETPASVAKASLPLGVAGGGNSSELLFAASSAVLWDMERKTLRFEQNAFERRPIASITKLMTAMVALDYGLDWEKTLTINLNEYGPGGNLLLHRGEEVTMRDLFQASLVGSANNATKALVRGLGITEADFVLAMNRKAIELGLEQTVFADATGLDPDNVSTAYEVARLAQVAFGEYVEIQAATSQREYSFTISGSARQHTIRNTNKLIVQENEAMEGSKTGYLDEAGWCLVMRGSGELSNRIAVILGSKSERAHFEETRDLLHLPVP